ncbi:hypothetical protein CA13_40390 [Planctomycetes bacterium CA13]|uniref:Uncharacterized protein n=1 Tax=Novipirellula herctigrandis TaxID=2527986 RepID=A0A5C5Z677_9BACT|nr:hypothetical protein CA13_40390 [Planctomycetes bacterium CA13]
MHRALLFGRLAFTLLELMVVIVLLVIVSGIGLLSIQSSMTLAARQRVISQIIALDNQERAAARRSPRQGRLVQSSAEQIQFELAQRTVQMPSGMRINRLLMLTDRANFASVSEVTFVSSGQSPTYAVEIVDARGMRSWIILLGISGQAFSIDNENEMTALLDTVKGAM